MASIELLSVQCLHLEFDCCKGVWISSRVAGFRDAERAFECNMNSLFEFIIEIPSLLHWLVSYLNALPGLESSQYGQMIESTCGQVSYKNPSQTLRFGDIFQSYYRSTKPRQPYSITAKPHSATFVSLQQCKSVYKSKIQNTYNILSVLYKQCMTNIKWMVIV